LGAGSIEEYSGHRVGNQEKGKAAENSTGNTRAAYSSQQIGQSPYEMAFALPS
jgi:hypothetical protein